jgi:putative endopeptidase
LNEITVPASMLQPPIFNADADDAANYGAIGALMGHELSHALDPGTSR